MFQNSWIQRINAVFSNASVQNINEKIHENINLK